LCDFWNIPALIEESSNPFCKLKLKLKVYVQVKKLGCLRKNLHPEI
jgi:hypothetical protein